MIYNLVVTKTAEDNALLAAAFYEQQQFGLGEQFVSDLESVYRKIMEHPQYYSYISIIDEFRDISLRKFPYVVIYKIHSYDVIVIDVFNTNRKPIL